jgi:predicted DCC family thiol-disulfide oxidoreductase YuxK
VNSTPAIVFYDGECALCHAFVKFILKHDHNGEFRFSPLQGETIKKLIPLEMIKTLPDSVVVRAFAGELFLKSDGAIYVLKRLGPFYRFLALIVSIFPRFLRDIGYNLISATRKKIFGVKADYCPIVPAELRERFLG